MTTAFSNWLAAGSEMDAARAHLARCTEMQLGEILGDMETRRKMLDAEIKKRDICSQIARALNDAGGSFTSAGVANMGVSALLDRCVPNNVHITAKYVGTQTQERRLELD